jgi:hypothetical protein
VRNTPSDVYEIIVIKVIELGDLVILGTEDILVLRGNRWVTRISEVQSLNSIV